MGPIPPPEPSPPAATKPGPTDGPPEPPVGVGDDGPAPAELPDAPRLPAADAEGPAGADEPPLDVDADDEGVANGSDGRGMDGLMVGRIATTLETVFAATMHTSALQSAAAVPKGAPSLAPTPL